MTYGIQEMTSHAHDAGMIKRIKEHMQKGIFNPEAFDLYEGVSRSKEREMRETFRKVPLREFLSKDTNGGEYLAAVKLHDVLYTASKQFDIVPLIGDVVSYAKGSGLTVDVQTKQSIYGRHTSSGGAEGVDTGEFVKLDLVPERISWSPAITKELLEDSSYGLIEWHMRNAAQAIGRLASDDAISVLKTATDGDGTVNSGSTGDVAETKWSGAITTSVEDAIRAIGDDEWVPDTVLTTSEAWMHSMSNGVSRLGWNILPSETGYDLRTSFLDILINNSPQLHASSDAVGATFTECVTVIFDRANALITARKNWLQMEEYSNPIEDLAGVVVSGRQDSATKYDDSIFVLTEST